MRSDSYINPGSFLPVILLNIGSRWNFFLQKHCLLKPVVCMSNLTWPSQMALSGIRFHHAGNCSTALCEYVVLRGPLDRQTWYSELLSSGYLKEKMYRNKARTTEALEDNIRSEFANTENDVPRRTVDSMQDRVQMCLRRETAVLNTWRKVIQFIVNLCTCQLSFISFRARVAKYRPERTGLSVWITLQYRWWMNEFHYEYGKRTDKRKSKYLGKKSCPTAGSFTINPTQTTLGSSIYFRVYWGNIEITCNETFLNTLFNTPLYHVWGLTQNFTNFRRILTTYIKVVTILVNYRIFQRLYFFRARPTSKSDYFHTQNRRISL
jgi:hypothetical protein